MKPVLQLSAALLLAGVAFSSPFEECQSHPTIPSGCVNITIPITASSNDNIPLPSDLNQINFFLLVNPVLVGAFDAVASGTYNIGATYCPGSRLSCSDSANPDPWVLPYSTLKFQLVSDLFSGTYTRSYWFGLYYSQSNSWVDYASSLGYATLSIDRLGNGLSDHPDPIVDVQLSYQAEELHQIILQARAGLIPETNTNFTRIIVVGHSLGSVVANCLNAKYPADADATLLTGYAFFYPPEFTGVFIQSWLAPADLSDPRYAGLSPAYLEANNLNYLSFLFYDPGHFSQSLQDVDFNNRGTISLGEAASIMVGSLQTEYTGPVLV